MRNWGLTYFFRRKRILQMYIANYALYSFAKEVLVLQVMLVAQLPQVEW